MGRSQAWSEVQAEHPSWRFTPAQWRDHFDHNPDSFHDLLASLYRVAKVNEQKRMGTFTGQKGGKPKTQAPGSVDELWSTLTPRYSCDPFPLAVKELMGGEGLRRFASRVPMDHRDLSRLINGKRKLACYDMERIATTSGVAPTFFLEYRIYLVTSVLTEQLTANPHASIRAVRLLAEV